MFLSASVPQNRQCAASGFDCSMELRLLSAAFRSSASVGLGDVGRCRIPGAPTPETAERRGEVGRELDRELDAGRGDSARGGRFCICRSPAGASSNRACSACFNCEQQQPFSFAAGQVLIHGNWPRTCASRSFTRMPIERLSIAWRFDSASTARSCALSDASVSDVDGAAASMHAPRHVASARA